MRAARNAKFARAVVGMLALGCDDRRAGLVIYRLWVMDSDVSCVTDLGMAACGSFYLLALFPVTDSRANPK